MSVLEKILEDKRAEVAERKSSVPLDELRWKAESAPGVCSLADALRTVVTGFSVIAEVKRASPSKGLIREDFDAVAVARAYEKGGARALSVLTDRKYFQGRLEYLEAIRREVTIPILRKDFMVDPYQVWESRAAGADAILLIVAAFDGDVELKILSGEAEDLGMDVLWEVHDEKELERVIPFGPKLVGINNRDLRTFDVSLDTTRRLLPLVPSGSLVVSESGFFHHQELEMMKRWGVNAFLIGESLMRAPDPGEALRELIE